MEKSTAVPSSFLKKPSLLQTFLLSVMTKGYIWYPSDEDEPQNNEANSTIKTENGDDSEENDDEDGSEGEDNKNLSSFVSPSATKSDQFLSESAENRRRHLDAIIKIAADCDVWSKLPVSRPLKHRKFDTKFKLEAIEYAKEHGNVAAARLYDIDNKSIRLWRLKEQRLRYVNELGNGGRFRILGGGRRKLDGSDNISAVTMATEFPETKHDASSSSQPIAKKPRNDFLSPSLINRLKLKTEGRDVESPPPKNSSAENSEKLSVKISPSKRIMSEPTGRLGRWRLIKNKKDQRNKGSFGKYEIVSTNSFQFQYTPEKNKNSGVTVNGDNGEVVEGTSSADDQDDVIVEEHGTNGEPKSIWDNFVKDELAESV